ncbi:MAG: hypothetical protein LBQ54_07685 [Planctomycetaceae bacterium]|nr:hypothetical protein [Planctomycetaceae bacterium]
MEEEDCLLNPENTQNACLVEMVTKVPLGEFNVGEIIQEIPNVSKSSWQVPYDEQFLNEDGTAIVPEDKAYGKNTSQTQIVFWLHYADFDKSLPSEKTSIFPLMIIL